MNKHLIKYHIFVSLPAGPGDPAEPDSPKKKENITIDFLKSLRHYYLPSRPRSPFSASAVSPMGPGAPGKP